MRMRYHAEEMIKNEQALLLKQDEKKENKDGGKGEI